MGDGRQGGLEGGHHPAVRVEVLLGELHRLVDPLLPDCPAVLVDEIQPRGDEFCPFVGRDRGRSADGLADRLAPQHAGLLGVGVGVGQSGRLGSKVGHGLAVVGRHQGHRSGAHQTTVADVVPFALLHLMGPVEEVDGVDVRLENLSGVVTDIGGIRVSPVQEVLPDGHQVDGPVASPFGQHVENAEGHLRVIGPLALLPIPQAATDHRQVGWVSGKVEVPELVTGSEGVTARRSEDRPQRPVQHPGIQSVGHRSFLPRLHHPALVRCLWRVLVASVPVA